MSPAKLMIADVILMGDADSRANMKGRRVNAGHSLFK